MLRKSKNVIGLDLGTSVVKAVEITLEGPEPVITGFARVEIPPGGSLADAVSAVFQEGNFRSRRVVTSVAGQSVVVRYLPMMKMSDAELRQAIRFETDKHLPFELDQVQMDCQALERAAPGAADGGASEGEQEDMTVLLAACKSDAIEEQVQLVLSCGLTPVAIDVDLFALANAWELCGLPPEDDEDVSALALVDVGATRTSINVLCGGETCFSREVAIGGQDMTQAVARRLGIWVEVRAPV